MIEVKEGTGKAKSGLLALIVLVVVVLIASNLWTYASLRNGMDSSDTIRVGLESEVATLQTENGQLQIEVDSMRSEIADLEWEIGDLESEIHDLRQVAEENRFEFYYADLAKQRFGVDDLDEYLDRWEWIEGTYVKGVFDCGEMSAYVEWRLENEGYHTCIVCGESPWGGGHHAWLLVEASEGAYMPVEATEYDVVWWSNPYWDNYFEYDHLFETIHDALDYSHSEFDWWN